MSRRGLELLLHYLTIAIFLLWILYPLLGVLELAFLRNGASLTGIVVPRHVTLSTLTRAWNFAQFGTALGNSAIVAGSVTVGCVLLSTLAGYAFGRMRFAGSRLLFYVFILGLVIPLEAYLIPLYFELRSEGLLDSRVGLILPLLAQSLPFGIFWMRASFRSMPQSLIEAAWIDGAGSFAVLRRILAPIMRPAILTLLVLTFVFTWNDFLLSLVVITSQQNETAPLALALFIGQRTTDVTGLAAGAVIISVPVIVVFVFFQRTLVRGILAGALKA
jgi:raffinose/stachyose/melibiose transport system permease protein